jgi:glycosyltransferase involved in cell wall biosynthesis
MAYNDGPLAAARREVAANAAQPADSPRESRSGVPATVGGIPIASAMLLPADHLDAESAWNQHIPFAFWLVQAHAPSIFVELGTYRGTSYFSFCQAVAALRLPTRCFAIDTWQGDSHAGFYDESVFTRVNACNERKYAGFSRLVRSSFDEALPHFLDGSIDLLHIDGLHTYEACRHDFESWLPKLSPRAIVLFHDTNVRERGFGVHRLWAELAERYPHFEFLHEHGLGVLGVGAALDAPVRELLAAADDAALTCEVRSTFWRLASVVQTKIDLKAGGEERARLETLLGVTIGECESEVSRLTAESARLRVAVEEKERQATELTVQCAAARSETAELGAALAAARSEQAELGTALAAARSEQAKLGTALAAARSENAGVNDALATARQAGADQQAALDKTAMELGAVRIRAERAETASAAARKELDAVRRSTSWRITQPLRQIAGRSRFARHASRIVKLLWWTITFQLDARVRAVRLRRANIKLIAASGLFDSAWYLEQYPDIRTYGIDPLIHYLKYGANEDRDPNPLFDTDWYLDRYRDVCAAGTNPLAHYLQRGAAEGCDPNPLFDSDWYLDRYPDVRAAGANPLLDYLQRGAREARSPHPLFDSDWYLYFYPEVRAAGTNPLADYLQRGAAEGRDPNPLFDSDWYLDRYPDVRAAGSNPLADYLQRGVAEGRDPNPLFDSDWYLDRNPDVRAAGTDPLVHYLQHGTVEGSHPSPLFDGGWYLDRNPDVRAVGVNPLAHYLRHGAGEGREAKPLPSYQRWIDTHDTISACDIAEMQRLSKLFPKRPLVSVVMPTYNTPEKFLREAIESVRAQTYDRWELCIADDCSTDAHVRHVLAEYAQADPRIKVARREENGHISRASNSALELAGGEWIALLDHDDLLAPHALFCVVDIVNRHQDLMLIYSDEDKIGIDGVRRDPYFKSDWNLDLFLSHNMFSHLGVYRRDLVASIGGFRPGFEGAQDYDLALRCVERISHEQICHIPHVLYHWRMAPGSTAVDTNKKPYATLAGERALNEHLERSGLHAKAEYAEVGYRVRYEVPQPAPKVTLIIPTRNGRNLLEGCISSILELTTYPNYDIIVIDNGSDDGEIIEYFEDLRQVGNIRVKRDDRPFNYSAINNAAVAFASGSIIGLINNDIKVISPDWLTEMVSLAVRPGVGAVGARLWYSNDTIQHAGVVIGMGGIAGHAHRLLKRGAPGYFSRATLTQSFSAVTGACLLVCKDLYLRAGGLNEDLAIAFNDIDFCLNLCKMGYRNLWTPYAELYHHESASRGADDTPLRRTRFEAEVRYMQDRWGEWLDCDPAYNANLALDRQDFSLAFPPRIEKPWRVRPGADQAQVRF